MPNRLIKESICTSENIDRLSAFQETFFYRLIVNCDDFGRMDARPKILASRLFPLKDLRTAQIEDALRALTSAELVILYEVDGKPFVQMKTWDRHQQVRARQSKYPAPDSGVIITEIGCKQMISDDSKCKQMISDDSKCPRNPIQSNTESNPNPNPTRTRARETDVEFDTFWTMYPKKVAKQDAIKAWAKLAPDIDTVKAIIEGLGMWKRSDEWQKNDGQFIPHPATWLNGRRWEDEVKPSTGKQPVKQVAAQQYEQRDYSGESQSMDDVLDWLSGRAK